MKPDIDAIRRRVEAPAVGPWKAYLADKAREDIPALLAYIDDLQAVADGARYMVKSQNGGYLEFHLHYGEALKQTEKALAKLDGKP